MTAMIRVMIFLNIFLFTLSTMPPSIWALAPRAKIFTVAEVYLEHLIAWFEDDPSRELEEDFDLDAFQEKVSWFLEGKLEKIQFLNFLNVPRIRAFWGVMDSLDLQTFRRKSRQLLRNYALEFPEDEFGLAFKEALLEFLVASTDKAPRNYTFMDRTKSRIPAPGSSKGGKLYPEVYKEKDGSQLAALKTAQQMRDEYRAKQAKKKKMSPPATHGSRRGVPALPFFRQPTVTVRASKSSQGSSLGSSSTTRGVALGGVRRLRSSGSSSTSKSNSTGNTQFSNNSHRSRLTSKSGRQKLSSESPLSSRASVTSPSHKIAKALAAYNYLSVLRLLKSQAGDQPVFQGINPQKVNAFLDYLINERPQGSLNALKHLLRTGELTRLVYAGFDDVLNDLHRQADRSVALSELKRVQTSDDIAISARASRESKGAPRSAPDGLRIERQSLIQQGKSELEDKRKVFSQRSLLMKAFLSKKQSQALLQVLVQAHMQSPEDFEVILNHFPKLEKWVKNHMDQHVLAASGIQRFA